MSHAKHTARRLLVAYIIAHLFLCVGLRSFAQTDSQAAVRGLIERFMEAYGRGDTEAAMSLWSATSPDFAASRLSLQQLFSSNKIALSGLSFGKITITGDQAEVRFVAVADMVDVRSGKPAVGSGKINRTVLLVKEAQGWRIRKLVPSEEELAAVLMEAHTEPERRALLDENKELVTADLTRAVNKHARTLSAQGKFAQALGAF